MFKKEIIMKKKRIRRSIRKGAVVTLAALLAACGNKGRNTEISVPSAEAGAPADVIITPINTAVPEPSGTPASVAEDEKKEESSAPETRKMPAGQSNDAAAVIRDPVGGDWLKEINEYKYNCLNTWGTWNEEAMSCSWVPLNQAESVSTVSQNSTRELSPYEKELNRLNAAILSASNELVSAQKAHENAVKEVEAAKENLETASATLKTNRETLETAKALLAQKNLALAAADTRLAQAQDVYADTIQAAQEEYDSMVAGANDVLTQEFAESKDAYDKAVALAQSVYDTATADAKAEYDRKVSDAESLKSANDAAANAKYPSAMAEAASSYNKAIQDAQAVYDRKVAEAQKTYDANLAARQDEYDEALRTAQADPDYVSAKANLAGALAEQARAVNDKQEKDQALAQAQEELSDARMELAVRTSAHDDAVEAKKRADAAAQAAQTAYANALAARDSAKADDDEAQKAVNEAQAALDEANQNKKDADNQLTEANKALEVGKKRISDAEAVLKAKQQAVTEAQDVINKGVAGFYEKQGEAGQRALAILNYASSDQMKTSARKTSIGTEDDATSLENTAASFAYLRKLNEIRKGEGLSEVKVTDVAMALAQGQANASKVEYGRAHNNELLQYQNGKYLNGYGENLYWTSGNGSVEKAYDGWYTKEKEVSEWFDSHPGKSIDNATDRAECAKELKLQSGYVQTGHYENIVDPDYTVAGYGINTDSRYGTTQINEFEKPVTMKNEPSYTVAEYEQLFLDYYSAVTKTLADATQERADAQARLNQLNDAKGLTAEEQQAIKDAEAEVEQAQDLIDTCTETLSDANLTKSGTADALKDSQSALDSTKETLDARNTEASAAADTEATTKDSMDAQQTTVDQDAQNVEDKQDAADEAAETLDAANNGVEDAQTEMNVQDALVAEETADEKRVLEEAEADTIVADTETEQKEIQDQKEADALNTRNAAEAEAASTREQELDASKAQYDTTVSDAKSVYDEETADALAEKTGSEADAADTKADADQKAQDKYDAAEAEAKTVQDRKDAEAKNALDEVQADHDSVAQEASDAADAEKAADQAVTDAETAEENAVERLDTAVDNEAKTADDVTKAQENLDQKNTDKDKFLNPEKYWEEEKSEENTGNETDEETAGTVTDDMHAYSATDDAKPMFSKKRSGLFSFLSYLPEDGEIISLVFTRNIVNTGTPAASSVSPLQ